MTDLFFQVLEIVWSFLPIIGMLLLASGIIFGFHKESWGDVLIFPDFIRGSVLGFLVCLALYLWIPLLFFGGVFP